jgi:DNA-binding HxlR family transcriptional regulator
MQLPTPGPDAFLAICPSRGLFARIAEKWTLLALVALEQSPLRFGALRRRLEGVSQKMLSQTLRNLERDGLIRREVLDARPLAVEYSLTESGRSLAPHVRHLKAWAENHFQNVEVANAEHYRRFPP